MILKEKTLEVKDASHVHDVIKYTDIIQKVL